MENRTRNCYVKLNMGRASVLDKYNKLDISCHDQMRAHGIPTSVSIHDSSNDTMNVAKRDSDDSTYPW